MIQNAIMPIPIPTVDHFIKLPVCGNCLLDCDRESEEGRVLETVSSFVLLSEVFVSSK